MASDSGLEADTIDHPTLQRLARAGALNGIVVAGDPDGWAILAQVHETRYPLVGQKSGVRHFRRMESAVKYLRSVGIESFAVDAHDFDADAMRRRRRRPDAAATLKRAHEAAEYDRWFREQVAQGLKEADDPNAEWLTTEEVMESMTRAIEAAAEEGEKKAKAK